MGRKKKGSGKETVQDLKPKTSVSKKESSDVKGGVLIGLNQPVIGNSLLTQPTLIDGRAIGGIEGRAIGGTFGRAIG